MESNGFANYLAFGLNYSYFYNNNNFKQKSKKMKTLKLVAVGLFLFVSSLVQSQVSVNVNIDLRPPVWGPVGYSNVEFYYLPDIEVYYDIRASQFIYFYGGRWLRSRYLPAPYRNYDLYNGYKVVLKDYHGTRPYTYFNNHRVKYYKGYKGVPQRSIGRNPNYHDNRGDNNGNRGNNYGKEHKERGNKNH